MANHPSAVKRYRQSLKRQAINTANRHKLRTQLKKLKTAVAAKKADDAKGLLPQTFRLIDKSVQKGVIKKNTAARYKSRLTKSINALTA